jgi:outer membrane protein TolC
LRATLHPALRLQLALVFLLAGCHHGERAAVCKHPPAGVECRLLHDSPALTASLEHIILEIPDLTPPRTASNPEGQATLELTLEQALAVALENSDVIRRVLGPDLIGLPALSTIYDPAISETQIQAALAAFDTMFETSMFWERTDKPTGQTFQGVFNIPQQTDTAQFRSALTKLFATGGQGRIAFNTDYLFVPFPEAPGFPDDKAQYTSNAEFSLRQPLLRGAGVDVNRSPIVVARLRSDQSLWEFKREVLHWTASIETAYWNLYAANVALRATERVLPLSQEVVRILESRLEFQKAIPADVAQARTAFIQFREQRIALMQRVLENEAVLRNLLGLPPNDTRRLVAVDDPLRAPVAIDWPSTVTTALDQRPDVVRQRLAVRVRELELLVARNGLNPQLDLQGLWRINGLGQELDDSIDVLTDNQFTDWQLGVSLSMPIGFRRESAVVQAAELTLDRERALLREAVHATTHRLGDLVRELDALYQQYQAAEDRVAAANEWLEGARIRFENPPPVGEGIDSLLQALNIYLDALRNWSLAATEAARLVALYNTRLAELEEAKGTLLALNNIHLQEDPCAKVRLAQRVRPSR